MAQVNGQSLLGSNHQEAVRALRSVTDVMTIMICDGFDPALINDVNSVPGQQGVMASKALSMSMSSVDCDDEDALILRKVGPRVACVCVILIVCCLRMFVKSQFSIVSFNWCMVFFYLET